MTLAFRHVKRKDARGFVDEYHSHHDAHLGEIFALGAYDDDRLCGLVVAGRAIAPSLDEPETWEVTRLCIGPGAPDFAASRLLGRIGKIGTLSGVDRFVSYTRIDEPGTCYLAAGWVPVSIRQGRPHTTGNRSQRWLPGLYKPSSEVIDRVRWERGRCAVRGDIEWNGTRWVEASR